MELQCGNHRENESQDEAGQDPVEKYLKKVCTFHAVQLSYSVKGVSK